MKRLSGSKSKKRFLHRHLLTILIIAVAIGSTAGGLMWYGTTSDQQIKTQNQATKQAQQEAKEIAATYKIQQEKLAAELKAKQEAAAKQAAEDSKSGTTSNIDPKTCNAATTRNNPASFDVVVNKKHCMQPLGYVPGDLVSANGATLSAKAIDSFKQMYVAAASAGQPFSVTSSYRSYQTQISTYNFWVAKSGQAGADTYSARPGYSEHQTGFAFDVAAGSCTLDCFGSTSQYQWFQQNAANYGFIQRYYAGYEQVTGYTAEEWHYRYVGTVVAKDMQAKGVKTLEQYWNVSGGDYF